MLKPYANDPRVAYIDLQNELDNSDSGAVAWAKAMLPYTRSVVGDIPLTVSVAGDLNNLTLQVAKQVPVDFYNFHAYMDPGLIYYTFQQALATIGPGKQLFIGETGYSTFAKNTLLSNISLTQASQDAMQDQYLRTVEYAAEQLGLPLAMPWIYRDFADNAHVLTSYLGGTEQYFGLFRADGTLKPAGASIASIYSGEPVDPSFNNGFEECDSAGLPVSWRTWQDASLGFEGEFACDPSVAHTGSHSARIYNSVSSEQGTPGYYLSPVQNICAGRPTRPPPGREARTPPGTRRSPSPGSRATIPISRPIRPNACRWAPPAGPS